MKGERMLKKLKAFFVRKAEPAQSTAPVIAWGAPLPEGATSPELAACTAKADDIYAVLRAHSTPQDAAVCAGLLVYRIFKETGLKANIVEIGATVPDSQERRFRSQPGLVSKN